MGSSKAKMMVSPFILDTVLHMNTYNLGMDGWQFNMQYARFKIYLQHNKKPRYVLQVIDFPFFDDRKDLYNYEQFIPYLSDTIIRHVTSQYIGRFTFPELYLPFFKYNRHLTLIQEGIKCYFKKKDNTILPGSKGYEPWQLMWDSSFSTFKKANPGGIKTVIQRRIVAEFEEFLSYCNANNIKVILEFAPVYHEEYLMEKNVGDVLQIFNGLSLKYSVPIFDHSNDSLCYDKKYFFNSQHLNKDGAELFSTTVANDLKDSILMGSRKIL